MPSASDAFRTTLDLFSTGLDLMRQNLRRDHPQADDDEIDRRLRQWLQRSLQRIQSNDGVKLSLRLPGGRALRVR